MLKKIFIIIIFITLLIIINYLSDNFFYNDKIIIDIGILFTEKDGPMAKNEKRLFDMIVDCIEYYNQIQNKFLIKYQSYNPKSSTKLYVTGAEILCQKNPLVIFGCWRSVDRKAIKPIIEKYNNLLCYPLQYEGNECSNNILYFGATPNQQVDIGIEYALKNISSKVLLIGSDYLFPRTVNKIMKNYITNYKAELLDEIYVGLDETNFDAISEKIVEAYSDENIVIMNTINGDSNKYFFESLYKKFKSNPYNQDKIFSNVFPIVSFSLTQNDIANYNLECVYRQYFVWNYNQSDISFDNFLENNYPLNSKIQNIMLKKIKSSDKIIDDPQYHVFVSFLFLVNFLESYKGDLNTNVMRENYKKYVGKKILTLTGYLQILENNHLEQPAYILTVGEDKKFSNIYRTPIEIKPNPWYDKFNPIKYECNNINKFMGEKYISS